MEVFYCSGFFQDRDDTTAGLRLMCRLDVDESTHMVKVLRHRAGDRVDVIDGKGCLYFCTLVDDNPRGAVARVEETIRGWGGHPYHLTVAVSPTKNNDRYEWFCEKATEIGLDRIVPVVGEHSERKVYKSDRARRIVLSAVKQSLKGTIPEVYEPVTVAQFISVAETNPSDLCMIACCREDLPRRGISELLRERFPVGVEACEIPRIQILIGPEGDFSASEVEMAISSGWVPVHLGPSRLRTETAALTATQAVYLHFFG